MGAPIRIDGEMYTVKDARWSGLSGRYLRQLQRVAGLTSVNSFIRNKDGARARKGAHWTGGEVLDTGDMPPPCTVRPIR